MSKLYLTIAVYTNKNFKTCCDVDKCEWLYGYWPAEEVTPKIKETEMECSLFGRHTFATGKNDLVRRHPKCQERFKQLIGEEDE